MRLPIVFFLILVPIIKISSRRIESAPEKFDRERYKRSRNRPKDKPFNPVVNDEKTLDFVALVNAFGYPAQEHTLETTDGYKIRIHRIPGNPSNLETKRRPVVFMHHGLLTSSDVWVLMGPTHDLAYMLADLGFDVWIGNARGNTYSRKHIRLSPNYDREFWRFSFHEMAICDVTSAIDYILGLTNQQKIIFIGHSIGATISYILLSEKPEYNNKIKLVVSLSPAVFWHNRSNKFTNFLIDQADIMKNYFEFGNIYELFPMTEEIVNMEKLICGNGSPYQDLCVKGLGLIVGDNPEQVNRSLVPHMLRYLPAGTSKQTLDHLLQIVQSGSFKKFDYGMNENFNIYNQKEPPLYNLSNIIAPVALFYGQGDTMIPKEDVITFSKQLSNVVTVETVPDPKFNHLDFIFARDLKTLLNDRLVQILLNALSDP